MCCGVGDDVWCGCVVIRVVSVDIIYNDVVDVRIDVGVVWG